MGNGIFLTVRHEWHLNEFPFRPERHTTSYVSRPYRLYMYVCSVYIIAIIALFSYGLSLVSQYQLFGRKKMLLLLFVNSSLINPLRKIPFLLV